MECIESPYSFPLGGAVNSQTIAHAVIMHVDMCITYRNGGQSSKSDNKHILKMQHTHTGMKFLDLIFSLTSLLTKSAVIQSSP